MGTYDLDAARAARAEAAGGAQDHRIVFDGRTFTIPFEIPWDAAKAHTDPDLFARCVLGDEQFEAFMGARPSAEDMTEFSQACAQLYGFESPGESEASSSSSSSNGKPSKPTSPGTTGSTSRKRSGAKKTG